MTALLLVGGLTFLSTPPFTEGIGFSALADGMATPVVSSPQSPEALPTQAPPSAGPVVRTPESLVSLLQRLDKLDKLIEPFPQVETLDPLYRFDAAARNDYKRYLKKVAPLYDHLMAFYPRLTADGAGQTIGLQSLSANTTQAKLLWERTVPFLTPEEAAYNSAQLMERTVANLYETVQYWRQRNQSQQPFRTSQLNQTEDDYVIQTKLLAARESMAELRRLSDTAQLLETGFKPQEGSQ